MKKHAYLICAHDNYLFLAKIMKLLDSSHNDFYIHINANSSDFDPTIFDNILKESKIIILKRFPCRWGDFGVINAQLEFFKTASSTNNYSYYHLLSGTDLPIKSTETIYRFFEEKKDIQFIHFAKKLPRKIYNEFAYKQILIGTLNKNYLIKTFGVICRNIYFFFQKILGIDNVKKNFGIPLKYGSAWWSITDEFVQYVLSKEDWIRRCYSQTFNTEESYMQTLIYSSSFNYNTLQRDNDFNCAYRLINWQKAKKGSGHPYIWRIDDLETIRKSKAMFARKFDENVDKNIINSIEEFINGGNNHYEGY